MKYQSLQHFLDYVQQRNPAQHEYLQAVHEVMSSLWPFISVNPRYSEYGLLERLVEPERVVQFRVAWVDQSGTTHVNRAWRVQHSLAIGPYKGGMRFHPGVNLSVLKFLGFEQTFKNALTTLPLGGGKGGSNFDPKGRSDLDVMRFCHALMTELFRHIGPDTDVPAGDVGVGAREIGFMAGMMKKLGNHASAAFTGKGLSYGGSLIRPEATGYGVVYFTEQVLATQNIGIDGMRVAVSGSGNVAQHAIQKAMALGARVQTASDSSGFVFDADGFTAEKLAVLQDIKNLRKGRIEEYARATGAKFHAGKRPWQVPVDIALPCAVENELDVADARALVANGVRCVVEGANMPTALDAIRVFQQAGVLFAPGKASNAGGVATSGLEMSQNALRLTWSRDEVDRRLREIISAIHATCVRHGEASSGKVNYVDGANIGGFIRVADAMLEQGVV